MRVGAWRTRGLLGAAILGLVGLALLDPRFLSSAPPEGAVFVLDVSESMGAGRAEPEPGWALRRPWLLVADGVQESRVSSAPVGIPRRASRLEAALVHAAERFPGAPVVLLSDGRETHGDARRGARAVAARGGRVYTAAPPRPVADVGLLRARVAQDGATVRVDAWLVASTPGAAVVELQHEGRVVDRRRAAWTEPGVVVAVALVDPAPGAGRVAYQVLLRAEPGTPNDDPDDDRLDLVRATAERVGEVWGEVAATDLAVPGVRLLPRAGRGAPVLGGVDLVVLSNTPWSEIGPEGAERLLRFVAGGGRLLVLGGPDAYGPGGWALTALEEHLLALRSRRPEGADLAVLLLLDRSASTHGRGLAHLRGAAARAGRGAVPGERLGVLAFAHEPAPALLDPGWIDGRDAPPVRERLVAALDALEARGGTDLPAALLAGVRELGAQAARQRRLLLLTDGDPDHPPDVTGLRAAREAAERAQIRIGALLVGDPALAARLREVVALAPGDVVELESPDALPEALLHWVARERGEREVVPGPAGVVALVDDLPPLDLADFRPVRMHALEAAPGAEEVLRTVPHATEAPLPFAARRRVGAGEVLAVAWGPEAEDRSRWAREAGRLGPWVAALAGAADRGLLADLDGRRLSVLWEEARGRGAIEVLGEGTPARLLEVAPGRFEGEVGPEALAGHLRVRAGPPPGASRPLRLPARPSLEHLGAGPDLEALDAIARAGGGQRLQAGVEVPAPAPAPGPSLAHGFLLLAVMLFLGERALR